MRRDSWEEGPLHPERRGEGILGHSKRASWEEGRGNHMTCPYAKEGRVDLAAPGLMRRGCNRPITHICGCRCMAAACLTPTRGGLAKI